MLNKSLLKALFFSIVLLDCKKPSYSSEENKLIAKVGKHTLYYSDLVSRLNSGNLENKDSLNMLYSLAELWCRDMVFLDEAKKAVKSNEEIEALIEDYRNSLLIDKYETQILQEKVDTNVTDNELMDFYIEKRGEYKLDGPIIKILYVKIKKSNLDEKIFKPLWENPTKAQFSMLQKYCADHAEDQILSVDKWQKWNEIKDAFPSHLINFNKLIKGMQQTYKDHDLLYYVKVIDLVKPNEDPPLSFVKEQAFKSILHIRTLKSLEERKKQLYLSALKSKEINIYLK